MFDKLTKEKWSDEKIKFFFGDIFARVDNWKEGNPKVEYEKVTVLYLKDKILEIHVILEKGNKDDANPEEKDNAKYYQEGGVGMYGKKI